MPHPPASIPRPISDLPSTSMPRIVATAALRMSNTRMVAVRSATPHRQANACARRSSSGRRWTRLPLPWTARLWTRPRGRASGRSEQQFHGSAGDAYPCEEHNNWRIPYGYHCPGPARVADSHASWWLACWCSGGRQRAAQPVRQVPCWKTVQPRQPDSRQLHHEFSCRTGPARRDPVNFVQVMVGPAGSVGASEQAVVDFIVSTFADGPRPDLIVAVAGPATVFARKNRKLPFPTHRSCSRPSTTDICARHRLGTMRPPSRPPTIFRDSSMTSSKCCPRPGRCSW